MELKEVNYEQRKYSEHGITSKGCAVFGWPSKHDQETTAAISKMDICFAAIIDFPSRRLLPFGRFGIPFSDSDG